MGKGSIRRKKYKTEQGFYITKSFDEKCGGRFWHLIEPLKSDENERFFEIKDFGDGTYEITGEGYIVREQSDLTDRLKRLRKEMSGVMIHYFFTDTEGRIVKREPHSEVFQMQYYWNQSAQDIFRCKNNGRVYCRLPRDNESVCWCTTSKMKNGSYEASSPIRRGLVIEVMNYQNGVEFTEIIQKCESGDSTTAKKSGKFSYEYTRDLAKKIATEHNLIDYNVWKKYVLSDKESYGFTGYDDTWVFCNDTRTSKKQIGKPFFYMSMKLMLVESHYIHNINKKEWDCFELKDKNDTVIELCGFKYEGAA